MFLLKHSRIVNYPIQNICRSLQHQTSIRESKQNYPIQNRKPKFDPIHFEESLKSYAEDLTPENQNEKLSNLLLPLWNYSYDKQLKIKQDVVEQSFDQIRRSILWDKRIDSQVLKYIEFQQGHFCHVEPIVPSPIVNNYRCRDEFSCGYGLDGEKTIGYCINPKDIKKFPNSFCITPTDLKSMKSKHLLTVKHFDRFVKQHRRAICENGNILKKDQYWRSITLKSNEQDHLMMIVVVHPQTLSKNEIDEMKKDLLDYFVNGSGRECEINSIYFQSCRQTRCTNEQNPFELIHGNDSIYEIYMDKKFRISPESFFQINKKAAELIFSSTFEHAKIDKNTILLDIGSGIGVHSILGSFMAKKVYAIDSLASCIDDGKINAKINQCRDNIEWIYGFSESHLHRILKKIGDLHGDNSRIIAIVNPSRYSLPTKTITTIRSIPSIKQILYVSCKSDEHTMHNFFQLATGEKSINSPFIPTNIYPFDLLPHTIYAETIVKCIRI